jgi:ligand-binding sensor domain-containing protein
LLAGGRTDLFVRNFLQTAPDEFWIGTESGIYIYNSTSGKAINLQKKYNDPYSLSDNAVYTFCRDREGGVWSGTYFGGINYYSRELTPFKKYLPKIGENSLSGNVVREIAKDATGNLWVGTEDAGLNKLEAGTGKFVHFAPTDARGSISYSNIHGLLLKGDELWIGTFEHGLDV